MKAYSLDLRQKVVAGVERGDLTIEEVARSPDKTDEALRDRLVKHCGYRVASS